MANLTNVNEQGIAIQGYDPVSYFTDHPVAGNPKITSTYEDATYYFISEENKAKFESDPEQYIPQYGGFCAVAVSEGKLVNIDPETYKVTDGKLYLFYNVEFGNTKPQWEASEETLRNNADAHWRKGDLSTP
ncbi:MAG: YHS domain-containing (seleno)protein [Nostocales cyanobacterium 94392]|nr:YHS domain-containing (seleno)protein [Nostocales cyanobacterium 94392]